MSYLKAPATGLLATNCVVCGRPLVDATSVEVGIGPECRAGYDGGIPDEVRTQANRLTHRAAIAAQQGQIALVRECATAIRTMGLEKLASRIEERFFDAEKRAKIIITQRGSHLLVNTPYRRGMAADFIDAWREIPGRRWSREDGGNLVPVEARPELWALLIRFFPGEYGISPKGPFRVPKAE